MTLTIGHDFDAPNTGIRGHEFDSCDGMGRKIKIISKDTYIGGEQW